MPLLAMADVGAPRIVSKITQSAARKEEKEMLFHVKIGLGRKTRILISDFSGLGPP